MKRSRSNDPIIGKTKNEHGPPPQRIILAKPPAVSNNDPKIFSDLAKKFSPKMMQRVKARGDKPVRVYAGELHQLSFLAAKRIHSATQLL